MTTLRWLHASPRTAPTDILDTLEHGDTPNPDPACTARVNERKLGIRPAHVYSYLNRYEPDFGIFVIALDAERMASLDLDAHISPFDSGGLCDHIEPVCAWDEHERCQYLERGSWHQSSITHLWDQWPGTGEYIDALPRAEGGPHELLDDMLEADIWSATIANSWQAHVWELRMPERLDVTCLESWHCPGNEYVALLNLAETDARAAGLMAMFAGRYEADASDVVSL